MLYEDFLEDVPIPLNDVFKMLEKSGVLLKVKLVAPEPHDLIVNGKELRLNRDELVKYLEDPEAFAANHFGLSVEQYREWFWTKGVMLCAAKTTKGAQCKHEVLSQGMPPNVWLNYKEKQRFCTYHEGAHCERYEAKTETYPPVVRSDVMAYLEALRRANPGM